MVRVGSPVPSAVEDVVQAQFVVGQDRYGQWLAVGTRHRSGGLFKTRDAALHFAVGETGHRPGSVELAQGPLQLRF